MCRCELLAAGPAAPAASCRARSASSYPDDMTRGLQLVEERTPAPGPWDTARRLAHLPHLLFLDSAGGPPGLARYSYVAADPVRWRTARGTAGENPFVELKYELAAWPGGPPPGLPPFQARPAG